jgi:hypothetical protein
MAGIKISDLPTAPSALLTDIVPAVQAGVTRQESLSQIVTLFNTNLSFLSLAGGTLTGPLILNADPTLALEAATKSYVDLIASGVTVKNAVRLATTAALTITYNNGTSGVGATLTNAGVQAALVIDGITVVLNDRILVKNQVSTLQNGVYSATNLGSGSTNWILTRATDYDQAGEIKPGDLFIVNEGNINAGSGWLETATVVTIGTDPINFSPFATGFNIANNSITNALLAQMPADTIKGNNTGSLANAADLTIPQLTAMLSVPAPTYLTTGAGNYTTPINVRYLKIRAVAGGGGGGGGGSGSGDGGAGGTTSITGVFSLTGGNPGLGAQNGGAGGIPTLSISGLGLNGGHGGSGQSALVGSGFGLSGSGGSTPFGGGSGASVGVIAPGAPNTGGGGSGGTNTANALTCGGGGGGGAYAECIVVPTASQVFAYVVGDGGIAGSAGTSGDIGSIGGSGVIIIEACYQ